MKDGFPVIDADRHFMEPPDLWDRYLDRAYRSRVQIGPAQVWRSVDGMMTAPNPARAPHPDDVDPDHPNQKWGATGIGGPHYRTAFGYAVDHDFDPASNLHDMDREGVDVAVSFPSVCFNIIWVNHLDSQLSAAICRAYNDWAADYCSFDPTRLKAVAKVPIQDASRAVQELRRAKALGLVGVFWRPNPLDGRRFDAPDYFPIYEAASELGMPICVHEGGRTVLPQAGADRTSAFGHHVASHPFEQMLACLNMCGDGVLERFPALKVAFLESGCGWLPFWLERMDEHWEHFTMGRWRTTKEPPSTYFKRQCTISTEAGEELIDTVVRHVGDDYIMVATDYPHPDAVDKFPDRTVGDLVTNPQLSDETKRKILWDNPARFYGITELPKSAALVEKSGARSSTSTM